ncbi:hypothetical protein OFN18_34090, partial [Escherichia coli]|nr:hypothetical protein [Escherichia coli]
DILMERFPAPPVHTTEFTLTTVESMDWVGTVVVENEQVYLILQVVYLDGCLQSQELRRHLLQP